MSGAARRYRHIIFDFDGVLAETNEIRVNGFRELFRDYPPEQVRRLIEYVGVNGGRSRYDKIRHFFNQVRNEPVTEAAVAALAEEYSRIVKRKIIEAPPVVGAVEFLAALRGEYDCAVVSGSDQAELKDVCRARNIADFFTDILGSPREKAENVALLLKARNWDKAATVFVGDSINDYDAARENGIDFIARDSGMQDWAGITPEPALKDLSELAQRLAAH